MSPGPSKQFDRQAVLERAMQLFWEEGYETTGIARLLEVLGIGRQSFYDTFGNKRSLLQEALAHYFRSRIGPIIAQLRAPGSGLENIRQVFRMYEQVIDENEYCGCLVGNTIAEQGRLDAEIAETLSGYIGVVENAFRDAIARAQADGELSEELDPRGVARLIVNTVQGVALLGKVLRDRRAAKSVIRAAAGLLETA
jgi:TetR/AcrR family transcriptional repressor of nem operon